MAKARPLLIFFAVTFAYAWVIELCMIVWHLRIELIILATLGPTLGALTAQRLIHGDYRAFRWTVGWPRTLAASALGIAAVIASFDVLPALATVDARKLHWSALAFTNVYNYSTLLGGPLFEEPGWRGFALPRLEAWWGPLPGTLLLGVIWASWHLPLFWYPGWTSTPIWLYFLMVIAFSVMLAAAANAARFVVIAPILMHAVFNTTGRYLEGLFSDAGPGSGGFLPLLAQALHRNLTLSFEGLIAIGGWIGAVAIIAATRGRLFYNPISAYEEPASAKVPFA